MTQICLQWWPFVAHVWPTVVQRSATDFTVFGLLQIFPATRFVEKQYVFKPSCLHVKKIDPLTSPVDKPGVVYFCGSTRYVLSLLRK